MTSAPKHPGNRPLTLLILILILILFLSSLYRVFDHDEFEHLHAAWYVHQGERPYADFFEDHHPLLWISLYPLLSLLGYGTGTVIAARLLMLIMTLAAALVAGRATQLISVHRRPGGASGTVRGSPEAGLITAALLLSMETFVHKVLEIRPDVPQMLFGLLAMLALCLLLRCGASSLSRYSDGKEDGGPGNVVKGNSRTQVNRAAVSTGLAVSVSFLYLQKGVILALFIVAVVLLKTASGSRRKQSGVGLTAFLLFFLSVTVPIIFFGLYLFVSGSFGDYLLTNWKLHIHHLQVFSPFRTLDESLVRNLLFWVLALLAATRVLSGERRNRCLLLFTLAGLITLGSAFLARHAFSQYFMLPIALLSVPAGWYFHSKTAERGTKPVTRLFLLILVIIVPTAINTHNIFKSNRTQLDRIAYVLDHSEPTARVYDGDIRFNLYRRDLHYFWYSVGENMGLDTYNAITRGACDDFDAVKLIRRHRPLFISGVLIDLKGSGLDRLYEPTPYDDLYHRIDDPLKPR